MDIPTAHVHDSHRHWLDHIKVKHSWSPLRIQDLTCSITSWSFSLDWWNTISMSESAYYKLYLSAASSMSIEIQNRGRCDAMQIWCQKWTMKHQYHPPPQPWHKKWHNHLRLRRTTEATWQGKPNGKDQEKWIAKFVRYTISPQFKVQVLAHKSCLKT